MKQKFLAVLWCVLGTCLHSKAALVAHYRFDEATGATAANDELAGTAGAVGSGVTTGVAGISGNAYSFAGSSASQDGIVDMGNASFFSAITTSGEFTFSVWVNTTDTTGNRNTVIFAGDNTTSNVYADLGVAAGQAGYLGSASARNRPVGADISQQTGIYSSPTVDPVNDGNWHLLVMTVSISSEIMSLYVDGVLANTQIMTTSALPNFNNFEIGRLGRSSPVDPYQGLVDDIQIYDQALTASEVDFLYANPGVAIPEPRIVALLGLGMSLSIRRKRG
ncbi:LamG domain-containing protein [Luteolibacter pohnpeiensis]|uniref:LamG domain-containing protein n=1 Tax=Luteolibacter pohnpeiensis TaxID=454153 RepID=A0A934VXG6_9BACT|nr:LamG domain-containing protein [Luteolibacter pohnpeiensis]MBK1883823.1 LamG domain-containing protein [Luteolibacter pohnpeiensis]